jgi:hypothetical protein
MTNSRVFIKSFWSLVIGNRLASASSYTICENIHLALSSLRQNVLLYMAYMGFVSEARAFAPSKRVGSLMMVVSAIVVAVLIFRSESSANSEATRRVVLSDEKTPRPTAEEKDSDGDTLKDWEEELCNLSPVNADTDGDGTGDLQEVENKRRTVADAPALILDDIDPNAPKPSPIALAGQILLSQFLTAKEAGVALPEQSIALASQIALEAADTNRRYETISITDLNLTNEPVSTRSYGNAVGAALTNTSGSPAPNELFVFLSYVQSSDLDTFQKDMTAVIERYDATIDGFMAVAVPHDRAAEHVALTNALIAVRSDLVDLMKVGDNPLMAIAALDAYKRNSAILTGLFEKLRTFLTTSPDAEFAPGEPAYAFIYAGNTE